MLDKRSKELRRLVWDAMSCARKGHFGSAMSIIEILRVLYDDILKFKVSDPSWHQRDRFILSKGHGCLALYSILVDKRFITLDDLQSFCKFGALLGGHPEKGINGIETSTGSLGHGLSVGVGMALAAKIRGNQHRVFVLVGDGELSEGSIWEACLSASSNKLDNLTVIIDRNNYQIFGKTSEVNEIEPLSQKLNSFGFDVTSTDGHNIEQIKEALTQRHEPERPRAIICNTIKGKGVSFAENNIDWHYKFWISDEEINLVRSELV